MRARFLLVFLCLGPPVLGPAAQTEGTTGADVLNTPLSARASALGGAYVSLGDDLSALSYNPSALIKLTGPSLDFLQFSEVAGVSLEDISYAQPLGFGTVGGGLVYQGQPAIANAQASDTPIAAWNLVITAAYAFELGSLNLDLPAWLQGADGGFSVKYIQEHLGEYDAYSGAADLGLHVPLDEGIILGASLLNLGPSITFIKYGDPLPTALVTGLSRAFEPLWNNQVNLTADLDVPFQDTQLLRFGAEDWIDKSVALRVGYMLVSQQSLGGFTGGVGIQLVQDGLTFNLDYAVVPFYYQGFNSFEPQQQFEMSLTF